MKNRKKLLLYFSLAVFAIATLSNTIDKPKKLQHVVAFNYKPEITEQQKLDVTKAFYALKEDIPQIKAFEGGADIQKAANKKFTHCFIVTVKDEKDLALYGNHPKHKAFSAMVDPMLAEVMVVDYWAD